ncbi:MAG: phosphoribosylanthranilate isomerase [Thermaurantiacus sp.]|nr:phosphoribosylanthranilate isomerase [Thermaurantiacus sp.]
MRVKICGITDAAGLAAAAEADAVGFNFVATSPRYVPPAHAASLIAAARALPVGVFADPDDALVEAAVAAGVRALQLHGRESPARIAALKNRFGLPVWKAAGIASAHDLRALARDFPHADAWLLDARPPAGTDRTGGHGQPFDWAILAECSPAKPWILAGGLNPGNVAQAIRRTGAQFVDVASGVEEAPGVKSLAKIRAFLREARHGRP